MNNIDLITLIIIASTFILIFWLMKKYFLYNFDKATKDKQFTDNTNSNIVGNSVLTDSNKNLINENFDGINENLNQLDKASSKLKELDQSAEHSNSYDIANESMSHQPQNRKT